MIDWLHPTLKRKTTNRSRRNGTPLQSRTLSGSFCASAKALGQRRWRGSISTPSRSRKRGLELGAEPGEHRNDRDRNAGGDEPI
ncbi:MAG: hypothetical protein WBE90_15775, partial [Xanthobacteraceae bacterium]